MSMTYTETLIVTHCWCGIALAIPETLNARMRESDKHGAYCPLGHRFVYGNTVTEQNEKLKADLERAHRRTEATRDLLRQEERSHAATRGVVTKLKKRASAGVCPCCHRSFENLRRHMTSKHPDYAEQASPTSETT